METSRYLKHAMYNDAVLTKMNRAAEVRRDFTRAAGRGAEGTEWYRVAVETSS